MTASRGRRCLECGAARVAAPCCGIRSEGVKFTIECDDKDLFEEYLGGPDALYALQDLDEWLRGIVKYGSDMQVSQADFADEVRTQLREAMDRHSVLHLLLR